MMVDNETDWINWLRLSGRSETTVAAYRFEIDRLSARYQDQTIDHLQRSDLLAYLAELRLKPGRKEEHLGAAALKRVVNALRSYYGFIGSRAAAELPMPRPKLRVQRTLNFEQALALLAACDTATPKGKRDLALLALMLDTGLRASEVCRLRVDQVDLVARSLHVVCKGGTDESGAFSAETANHLSAWLAARVEIANCPQVFVSFDWSNYGGTLTTGGLRCLFRDLGRRAGLAHLSPHDLRRSFATLATLLGAPGRIVQKAGRWHDLKLVERYTQAITADEIAPYSPVSSLLRQA